MAIGICIYSTTTTDDFDDYCDILLANGITTIRLDVVNYQFSTSITRSKAAALRAIAKGLDVVWGICSSNAGLPQYTITKEGLTTWKDGVKAAATWAQANGISEFIMGNEDDNHCWFRCEAGSLVRNANVVTVTTPAAHGFSGTNQVYIEDCTPTSFNGTFDITVTGDDTFTYAQTGANESNTGTARVSTITISQFQDELKSLATEVQAIFTNGNVIYSFANDGSYGSLWIAKGRGDIDILGANTYMGGTAPFDDDYQTWTDALVAEFGADHIYTTEFNLRYLDIDNYSEVEVTQALAVLDMLTYFQEAGIENIFWFSWGAIEGGNSGGNDSYGVLKVGGTYRKLWDVLKGESTLATLVDSYSESNKDSQFILYTGDAIRAGQCFTAIEGYLDSCKFWLNKSDGTTGTLTAKLYALTGTYGTNGKPTGDALATSGTVDVDTGLQVDTYALITFSFTGANRVLLEADAYYVITVELTGGNSNGTYKVRCGIDESSPSHDGNACVYVSSWSSYAADTCFYTYVVVDVTAPVITLLGEAEVELTVGDSYEDAGATAEDDIDGDITDDIVTVNPVDKEVADTYTVTYNVSDAVGNDAVEVTRTVIVSEAEETGYTTRRTLRTGYHRSLN